MKKETWIKALCILLALALFVWFVFFFERDGAAYVEPDGNFEAGESWQVENGFSLTLMGVTERVENVPEMITRGEKWQPGKMVTLHFSFENQSQEILSGYELAALFSGDDICAEPYPMEEKQTFFPGEAGTFVISFAAAADADATHVNIQYRLGHEMRWATFKTA